MSKTSSSSCLPDGARRSCKARPTVPLLRIFKMLDMITVYCNRRNFRTRFNFVLLAESTKCSSIRKPCKYNSVCDTALAVRNFYAYESSRTPEFKIFTRTKISAITVFYFCGWLSKAMMPGLPNASTTSSLHLLPQVEETVTSIEALLLGHSMARDVLGVPLFREVTGSVFDEASFSPVSF